MVGPFLSLVKRFRSGGVGTRFFIGLERVYPSEEGNISCGESVLVRLLGVLVQRCVEGTEEKDTQVEEQIIWKANGAKFNMIILCLVKTIP